MLFKTSHLLYTSIFSFDSNIKNLDEVNVNEAGEILFRKIDDFYREKIELIDNNDIYKNILSSLYINHCFYGLHWYQNKEFYPEFSICTTEKASFNFFISNLNNVNDSKRLWYPTQKNSKKEFFR
ncbi:hypothetical protein [Bacillus sp. XF8]|uniref:hypothetical protein n=1 Tax=Bacillus sp. XF8 TaxID=2819289 RepID=UPI001AA0926E|nr:hypothetical protein [Bacillus sp. XF8]MBO1580711.1 hypothetical protein [Bacillus sp. XF8]